MLRRIEKAKQKQAASTAKQFADGTAHLQAGRFAEAEKIFRKVLAAVPHHVDALRMLGIVAAQAGRLDEAIERFEQALRLKPEFPEALGNLGIALKERGRLSEAIMRFEQALRFTPNNPYVLNSVGAVLAEQGKFSDATERFERALQLKFDFPEALVNLGDALLKQGLLDEAIERYRQALRFRPDFSDALNSLGWTLARQGKLDDAIERFKQALRFKPNFPEALANMGWTVARQGRLKEAVEQYQQALRFKPDYAYAYSAMLLTLNNMPDITDDDLLRAHQGFEALCRVPVETNWTNTTDPERPLRIGYVSGDFCEHVVAFFLEAVWIAHDRGRVEIYAYSDVAREDQTTERLRQQATEWRRIVGMGDAEVTALIRADAIDILVDLAGHSPSNRLPMFARRPAPVQVSWLGYPHTTGLSAIDAVLMDAATVPAGNERWFVEEVVRLPGSRFCYRPPAYAPATAPPPCLASERITFGSFNNISKYTPQVFAVWAELLTALPGSRLLLSWKTLDSPFEKQRLSAAFAAAGGDPDRLDMRGGPASHESILADYAEVDIALDPFPYGGGTTTFEALWMGVPVVTWPGTRPVSRQSLGILACLGLDAEMSTSSTDGYVEAAIELARSPSRLSELRSSLRTRMQASPLCDGPGFTGNLEAAYRTLWKRWCERASRE